MTLPAIIPIFPLPNVVLFPDVPLPLHIFEPRYREMVRDVSAESEPVIGMTLLRGDWRKDYYANPDVFSVGCAGRVVNVQPLPDGRYNILLYGLREFEIEEEAREHSYRRARVRWRGRGEDTSSVEVRSRLMERVRGYVESHGPEAVKRVLLDTTLSDEARVNLFCYALDLAPVEKQGLLEASSWLQRAQRLCEVLDFALEAGTNVRPENERYH